MAAQQAEAQQAAAQQAAAQQGQRRQPPNQNAFERLIYDNVMDLSEIVENERLYWIDSFGSVTMRVLVEYQALLTGLQHALEKQTERERFGSLLTNLYAHRGIYRDIARGVRKRTGDTNPNKKTLRCQVLNMFMLIITLSTAWIQAEQNTIEYEREIQRLRDLNSIQAYIEFLNNVKNDINEINIDEADNDGNNNVAENDEADEADQ